MTAVPARWVWVVVVLGCAWRILVAGLTPVPSEDGVTYLWMAERLAEGRVGPALEEVFPPLLAMLAAVPVALGIDPFRAGQLVLILAGGLAAWPIARLAERLAPGTGLAAAWLSAFLPLPARYCAEVYTEPLFVLVGGAAALAGLRGRPVLCGALTGVAFWARPEALLILLCGRWRSLWPALALVGLLALAGADPLAKLWFNWPKATLGAGEALPSGLLSNALLLPGAWLEAFTLPGLLALVGLVRLRGGPARRLRAILGLSLLVLLCFVVRRRFLVDWLFVVAPFAAAGLSAFGRRWRLLLVAATVASGLALSLRVTAPDRAAERLAGAHLRALLAPGERVASDMTRVLYYAGQRPLPPRHLSAEELVAAARAPGVRFLVLGSRRPTAAPVLAELAPEFRAHPLPAELAPLAESRGLTVLERR